MNKLNNKILSQLLTKSIMSFSQVQTQAKSYKMPVRQVVKKFKPRIPVHFYEGRALIYLNKQGLFTPTLLTAHLTVPMIYLAYLIKNNPFYLSFPAALPIMGFIEIFFFARWVSVKRDNKYHIQRVYLSQDGDFVQVWFSNKIRRTLKNTPDNKYFQVKELKPPPVGQNEMPRRGSQFPQNFSQIRRPAPWQYGWYKYDDSRENYIIPKNYQYINMELMIPVMKGVQVDTTQCPKTAVPIDELRKMPTLDEALQEAKQKIKFEQEWVKKNGQLKYTPQDDI